MTARMIVAAGPLREALHTAHREVTVGVDEKGQISIHPHADRDRLAAVTPALQSAVTIRKDRAVLNYLRPFRDATSIVVLPSHRLIGKARGASGVTATMHHLVVG